MPSFSVVLECGSCGMRDNVRFFKKALNFKHKIRLKNFSREEEKGAFLLKKERFDGS